MRKLEHTFKFESLLHFRCARKTFQYLWERFFKLVDEFQAQFLIFNDLSFDLGDLCLIIRKLKQAFNFESSLHFRFSNRWFNQLWRRFCLMKHALFVVLPLPVVQVDDYDEVPHEFQSIHEECDPKKWWAFFLSIQIKQSRLNIVGTLCMTAYMLLTRRRPVIFKLAWQSTWKILFLPDLVCSIFLVLIQRSLVMLFLFMKWRNDFFFFLLSCYVSMTSPIYCSNLQQEDFTPWPASCSVFS